MLFIKRILVCGVALLSLLGGLAIALLLAIFLMTPEADGDRFKILVFGVLPSALVLVIGGVFLMAFIRSIRAPQEFADRSLKLPLKTLLVLLCCTPVVGLFGWQYSVSIREIQVCGIVVEQQERQVQKMRAARANWERLQSDIKDHDAVIIRQRQLLPLETDVIGFCDRIETWLKERGLGICERSTEIEDRDFYRETKIELAICGLEAERARVAAEPWKLIDVVGPQLITLESVESHDQQLRLRIVAYSYITSEIRRKKDWCDQNQWPLVRTWLPPFSIRAKNAREQLAERCPAIIENREFIDAVDELEAQRELVIETTEIIKTLTEKGGAQSTLDP